MQTAVLKQNPLGVAAIAGGERAFELMDQDTGVPVEQKVKELSLIQRIISASTGAVLTSLLVTPLDVVKTRLQAQLQLPITEAQSAAQCPKCTHFAFHNGLAEVMVPKTASPVTFRHKLVDCPEYFTGTFDALYKISKFEGPAALFNGLRPSLIMAVPSTVLYFASYDKIRDSLRMDFGYGSSVSALLAGSSSRILAATCIAPLELVRTRSQAIRQPPSMISVASGLVKEAGIRSLWKGLSPTLWRDVPFSAIYWLSVENAKTNIRKYYSNGELLSPFGEFLVSFAAGAGGGMVAATLTHPFDVIKTRRQVLDYAVDIEKSGATTNAKVFESIVERSGYRGLMVGLFPRLAKVAPACAIMLSSYEAGKQVFLQID
mmetsp:Transcript_3133/g.5921  ORF Transcript_3133/g.5921 Transcript_3133/m.5921 type:complete len:375 (-) Transcript_3133:693-1817(-)